MNCGNKTSRLSPIGKNVLSWIEFHGFCSTQVINLMMVRLQQNEVHPETVEQQQTLLKCVILRQILFKSSWSRLYKYMYIVSPKIVYEYMYI